MNGAIGIVVGIKNGFDLKPEKIVVQFSTQTHDIERVTGKFEIFPGAYIFRKQFPISITYGIIIHKSQGMSLNNCLIDVVGNTIFSCGQTYVALSRVSSLNGLYLINFDSSKSKSQTSTIKEYNRLRCIYRTDLKPIQINLKNNVLISDFNWVINSNTIIQNIDVSQPLPILDMPGFTNSDGVSCYVNSTLQVLLNCGHILNHIINNSSSSELQNLAFSYVSNNTKLNTSNMRRSLGQPFNNNQQQDVAEFIDTLFQTYDSIQNYFTRQMDVTLTCSMCYLTKIQSTPNNIVHLNIPKNNYKTTIQSLFNDFSKLIEINAVRCSSCNTCCIHHQTIKITINQYLFLQVLLWSNNFQNKFNNLIINEIPTTKLKVNSNYYRVHSVICHHGEHMTKGHYTSLIRHQNNNWLRCNDTQINYERWPWEGKDIYIIVMEKNN